MEKILKEIIIKQLKGLRPKNKNCLQQPISALANIWVSGTFIFVFWFYFNGNISFH